MMRRLIVTVFLCTLITPIVASAQTRSYATPDRGGTFMLSSGVSAGVETGYGKIQANPGQIMPAAYAQFEYERGGVTVSQATVPASVAVSAGRIYAEVGGAVNTGIAMANPGSQPAVVSFYLTDANGQNFGQGSVTIPAGGQIARFLNEAPFNGGATLFGTFTFSSSSPIGVIALRGYTNERGEFLMTTLPVADLNAPSGVVFFPHFAEGGGWTTQIILVNPTDSAISGTIVFTGQGSASTSGSVLNLTVNGQAGITFPYSIPARSSANLRTSGQPATAVVGSVRVTPSVGASPYGVAVFSFRNGGVTVTEAGVPLLRSGTAFRLFIEENIETGADVRQTGIAIANPGSSPAAVNLELTGLNGSVLATSTVTVPANGQTAVFTRQLAGLASAIPEHFHGVLRISTTSAEGISVIGLKGRYNARNDFLITTAMAADETAPATRSVLLFPHVVDGGGYVTEYVLFSGTAGVATSGFINFFNQLGQPSIGF